MMDSETCNKRFMKVALIYMSKGYLYVDGQELASVVAPKKWRSCNQRINHSIFIDP